MVRYNNFIQNCHNRAANLPVQVIEPARPVNINMTGIEQTEEPMVAKTAVDSDRAKLLFALPNWDTPVTDEVLVYKPGCIVAGDFNAFFNSHN